MMMAPYTAVDLIRAMEMDMAMTETAARVAAERRSGDRPDRGMQQYARAIADRLARRNPRVARPTPSAVR
jgi:hypothetical protein